TARFTLCLLAATLFLPGRPEAQCKSPQGNANLYLHGLPEIGRKVTVGLSGRRNSVGVLGISPTGGQLKAGFGEVCIGVASALLLPLTTSQSGNWTTDFPLPPFKGLKVHFQGVIVDNQAPNGAFALSNAQSLTIRAKDPNVETIFFDDFEAGQGKWSVSNGLWEIGIPAFKIGPSSTWSGRKCAGTDLDAKYPAYSNTILRSPPLALPSITAGQVIRANYRVWYYTEDRHDYCVNVVSTDLGKTWSRVIGRSLWHEGWSKTWTQASVDLSAFAGKTVLVGFQFLSNGWGIERDGVYLDDFHVFRGTPVLNNPEGWENGIGPWWSVNNGLWEVGAPSAGFCRPRTGSKCAAVLLHGKYPAYAGTALVSPPIRIPRTGTKELSFWHCFNTEVSIDLCYVQISVDGGRTWANEAGPFSGSSDWTRVSVFLNSTMYGGKTILVAFTFSSNGWGIEGYGWFIDDISIK
ncbi:MAG: choice-of-anchor J domain-containing protein, partial [Planctomycetota bacterium]